MITPFDNLQMRQEAGRAGLPYRETTVVIPTITSGSNYEAFTDSAYDVTGARSGQYTATYTSYRLQARIKVVRDTTLIGISQVVPGIEVGDYLMYFSDMDKPILDAVVNNKESYIWVDGIILRPYNTTLNGLATTFDVFVHGKKFSPKYRMAGT